MNQSLLYILAALPVVIIALAAAASAVLHREAEDLMDQVHKKP